MLQSSVATGVISLRSTLVPLRPRRRVEHDPGRPLPRRADAADGPGRCELARAPRPDDRADARLGAGRARHGSSPGSARTRSGRARSCSSPFRCSSSRCRGSSGSSSARSTRARHTLRGSCSLAAAIHFALGWTKSLPVTIGRPRLRIVTHGLETLVAIPLVAVLGVEWGATGAAVAVLVSTLVFAARGWSWSCACATRCRPRRGVAAAVRVVVVSGIWPPDPGGPASHAPALADFLAERGHEVEVVTTADSEPAPRSYPVSGRRGARRCDTLRAAASCVRRRDGRTSSTRRA